MECSPEEEGDTSQIVDTNNGCQERICQVCADQAAGSYFGALVCIPCKAFFIRSTSESAGTFECPGDRNCKISVNTRTACKFCRFQKCISAGMCRKERPTGMSAGDGHQMCVVCEDQANGVHFGAVTCEGCKKFFRRGLKECKGYVCKGSKECLINPRTRNNCRYCRFQKCLKNGMSREAIQMGRPSKFKKTYYPILNEDLPFLDANNCPNSSSNEENNGSDHLALQNQWMVQPYINTGMGNSRPRLSSSMSTERNRSASVENTVQTFGLPSSSPRAQFQHNAREHSAEKQQELREMDRDHVAVTLAEMFGADLHQRNERPVGKELNFLHGNLHANNHMDIDRNGSLGFAGQSCGMSPSSQLLDSGPSVPRLPVIKQEVPMEACAHSGHPEPVNHTGGNRGMLGCGSTKNGHFNPFSDQEQNAIKAASIPGPKDLKYLQPRRKEVPSGVMAHVLASVRDGPLDAANMMSAMRNGLPSMPSMPFPPVAAGMSPVTVFNEFTENVVDRFLKGSHHTVEESREATKSRQFDSPRDEPIKPSMKPPFTRGRFIPLPKEIPEWNFESMVNKDYWLKAKLPDENIIFTEEHQHLIDSIITHYHVYQKHGEVINGLIKKDVMKFQETNSLDSDTPDTVALSKGIIMWFEAGTTFCLHLPGFSELDYKNKATLIRNAANESRCLLAAIHWYNPISQEFEADFYWNKPHPKRVDWYLYQKIIKFSQEVVKLNLDSIEAALMNALLFISSDDRDLAEVDLIANAREKVLRTFRAYTTAKYGSENQRIETLFQQIPKLAEIGISHNIVDQLIVVDATCNSNQSPPSEMKDCSDPQSPASPQSATDTNGSSLSTVSTYLDNLASLSPSTPPIYPI